MNSIVNFGQRIIDWANSNSGFITLISTFLGSGVVGTFLTISNMNDKYAFVRFRVQNGTATKRDEDKYIYYLAKRKKTIRWILLPILAISLVMTLYSFFIAPQQRMNSIVYTGKNRVLYYSTATPVSERVLVPDESAYQEITMEARDVFGSGSVSTRGYHGRGAAGDSVVSAFTAEKNDRQALIYELKAEILQDPLIGDMIVQGLSTYYPEILERYEKVKQFCEKSEAAYNLPDDSEGQGLMAWMVAYRFRDGEDGAFVTDAYRLYAEEICKMIDDFDCIGVIGIQPEAGYVSNMRLFDYKHYRTIVGQEFIPYNGPDIEALAFVLHENDGNELCRIAFDLDDKGLFIY